MTPYAYIVAMFDFYRDQDSRPCWYTLNIIMQLDCEWKRSE